MSETGWKSAEVARRFRAVADLVTPGRRKILEIICRAATEIPPSLQKILDIGAGYGDVTATILEMHPGSSVCLVDFNDEMLNMAAERFSSNEKITTIKHDLEKGLPAELDPDSYDAVVSCFALHHIAFDNRVRVYRDILRVLTPGGLFINGDRFRGESPILDEWEFDNWMDWIVENAREKTGKETRSEDIKHKQIESDQRLGDKPGTIWDMRQDLFEAGFVSVDCLWMHLNLGILAAVKSTSTKSFDISVTK